MTKKLKIYQVLTFALGLAFIALCLFVGITAVQKSMKLNMSFQINPSVLIKIEAKGSGEAGYTTIFQNSGETTIKNGVNLSGNTLSFGTDYANGLGTSFSLKITNLTSCRIMAELGGASFSKSNLAFASVGSAAQEVTVSAVNGLTMNCSQVFAISKGSITNATITPKSNVYTIDSTYYVKQNEEASFTLTGSGNYATPAQGAIGLTSGSIKSYSDGTLTLNTLTSDTTITINNTTGKTYTVTKGSITGFAWGTVPSNATFNTDYTFTLVLQDGYKIDGATVQAVITGGSTVACTQTAVNGTTYTFKLAGASITGNVTINATAALNAYSITFNTSNCTKTSGETTVTPNTAYSAQISPTGEYVLPKSGISITVGGQALSASNYTFNGVSLSINAAAVTGNIVITANAVNMPYTMIGKYTLDNLNNKSGALWIDDSISYTSGSTTVTYNLYNSALANYYYFEMGDYEQDNTGSAEKVRWLVLGMPIGTTSNGVFTANNNGVLDSTSSYIPFVNTTNGSTSLGGWQYDETSNKFQYYDDSTWLDCPQVLVISDMALINQAFDSSYSGNAWNVDGRIEDFINGSDGASGLYGTIFTTDAQKNRILKTFIKTTSYYDGSIKNAEGDSGNSYKMFLLGNDDYSGYNATESYALEDIFNVDAKTGCHEVRAMVTLYAKAQGASVYQSTNDSYKQYNGASYWWLRSGLYSGTSIAYGVYSPGYVRSDYVNRSDGVRPSFVLNLA